MKNKKDVMTTLLFCVLIFGLSVFALLKAPDAYSMQERRSLAQFPVLKEDTLLNGKFMTGFESYAADQFPMRDGFRTFKAVVKHYVFGQKDNNGLYLCDGHLSKLEYPMNMAKVGMAAAQIEEIRRKYLEGTDCSAYLSIIPDKNAYLAPAGGYPKMDYDVLISFVKEKTGDLSYIDVTDLLSLDDFYRTDQHWKQECVTDVAERIASRMQDIEPAVFAVRQLDAPFYGTYVGMAALPVQPDTISYLTSEMLEHCTVKSYRSGAAQEAVLYDFSKADGRDPYEMFLGGADPLMEVENPAAEEGRELVVFRDSFGSSLVPLLIPYYRKITLVDLRYMKSALLKEYLTFDTQDVLFLYSTLTLNSMISMG